jgi:hypothetical protein
MGLGPSVKANGCLETIVQNLAARLPQPSQPLPLGSSLVGLKPQMHPTARVLLSAQSPCAVWQ